MLFAEREFSLGLAFASAGSAVLMVIYQAWWFVGIATIATIANLALAYRRSKPNSDGE